MLKKILSLFLLIVSLSYCGKKTEIKVLNMEKVSVSPEHVLDGNAVKLISPALKLDKSMDFKAYYHHFIYDEESGDTVSLLSPIAFTDTEKDYQFISDHSYAYILMVQSAMKDAGLQDSLYPEIELVVYSPDYEASDISNSKAIIGALYPLNE